MNLNPLADARAQKAVRKCDGSTGLVRYATTLPDLYGLSYGSASRSFPRASVQPNFAWLGMAPPPQANLQRPWEDVCVNCIITRHLDEKRDQQKERVSLPLSCIEWAPDGTEVICAAEKNLGRYDDVTFGYRVHNRVLKDVARCMKWLSSVNYFLIGDEKGCVYLFPKSFNSPPLVGSVQKSAITDLSVGPHDFKFAASSEDKDHPVVVYDMDNDDPERCDRMIPAHDGATLTLDWHPASSLVATGGEDKMVGMLKVWDVRSDGPPIVCRPQDGRVSKVRWNPNGNWLAVGGGDSTIKIYDIRKFEVMCKMQGHKKEISCLAWHPIHESLLVSGCNEGAIMHWLVGYTHPIASIFKAHRRVSGISWHPSCHTLTTCGFEDKNIKFWTRLNPGANPSDPATFAIPIPEQFQARGVMPRY